MMHTLARLCCLASLCWLSACNKQDAAGGGSDKAAGVAAAAAAGITAKPPVEGELVLTATLKDISGPFPANDIYNYAYVMRYEVGKVIQGTYGDAEVLVGHYNPRLARAEVKDEQDPKVGGNVKSFQVGDVHYLVLTPMDKTWTGAVEDDYYQDKRDRYWALWADKIK